MLSSAAAASAAGSLLPCAPRAARPDREAARLAVGCLHAELLLYPKPGLVSAIDNGSHGDMNATTFMRSLFALRHYYAAIWRAGAAAAPFATLCQLGIDAEQRMLAATGGVNTHRGAIFSLGLLCAALGRTHGRASVVGAGPERQAIAIAAAGRPSAATLRAVLLLEWGKDLAAHAGSQRDAGAAGRSAQAGRPSHGGEVARRHAAPGAREEAALGLPSVFEIGLPALRRTLRAGRGMQAARIDALFALMAHISDTNVLFRGGAAGAALVRQGARGFLDAGGSACPGWHAHAIAIHRQFVARRLSPGGAADLLAATCLVHEVCR